MFRLRLLPLRMLLLPQIFLFDHVSFLFALNQSPKPNKTQILWQIVFHTPVFSNALHLEPPLLRFVRRPSYVNFEYPTFFDSNISGVLKYGGIEELKGVQVRKLLIWFDVVSIKVDLPPSDFVYFEFAWICKKLRMDQFLTVPNFKDKDLLTLSQEVHDRMKQMTPVMFDDFVQPFQINADEEEPLPRNDRLS